MTYQKYILLFSLLISLLCIPLAIAEDQDLIPALKSAVPSGNGSPPHIGEYPVWPSRAEADVRYVPGQVLVRFDPSGLVGQSVTTLANSTNAKIGALTMRDYSAFNLPGLQLVSVPDSISVQQAVSYYTSTPGVLYAEPDLIYSADRLPDDPEFWRQYGLENTGVPYKENTTAGTAGADIHAPGGWEKITSTNGTIIAVVDSGVDMGHPDLTENLWFTDQYDFPLYGYNIIDGESYQPFDDDGHGTHCAGIIGMAGNNQIGGTGVAWNTSVMAIKVLNSFGLGKLSDLVLGMAYASNKHVPVISCSFGLASAEKDRSRAMEDVIRSSDSLFVCCAGNDGSDDDLTPHYPSSYQEDNVISVASTDAFDNLSSFSNWGNNSVHVAAPGSEIYSTLPSYYSFDSIWKDPNWSSENLTLSGNWTILQPQIPGGPVTLHGFINTSDPDATLMIEMKQPVNVTEDLPSLTWDWIGGISGTMRVEYTLDGVHWETQKNDRGATGWDNLTQQSTLFTHVYKGSRLRFRISFWPSSEKGYVVLFMENIGIGYRNSVIRPNYDYKSGTSMATPMVAGMAGLIKGTNPDLTAKGLKLRIMETVDPIPSLKGKIATGGRVNLTAALNTASPADVIHLQPGWNHLSVPRHLQAGYDTAQIFADIHSAGHSVLMFTDNQTGWKTLNASDPIVPLQGYWVFSEDATQVPVRVRSQVVNPARTIRSGWSSVGGWSESDLPADQILASLGSTWSYLFGYNATVQQYDEVIIRNGSGNQSDSRQILPWQGYWLYCIGNGTYQGPQT